jgi:hypothetical protein
MKLPGISFQPLSTRYRVDREVNITNETPVPEPEVNITNETWFFNVKEANLDFGAVLKPNKIWRQMNFTNDRDYPVIIYHEITGTAAPYVYVEPKIIISPKTAQLINITIITTAILTIRIARVCRRSRSWRARCFLVTI